MAPPKQMPRIVHDSKSGDLRDHEENTTVEEVDDEVDPTATDHPVSLKETEVDPTAADHQPKSGS